MEDGNCLFRSICINIEPELMECIRYKNGKCKTHSLSSRENSLSSSLREFTTILMENDKEKYRDGPPFGVTMKEIETLSSNKFEIMENYYSDLSVESRKNREKVIILKKI